MPSQEREISAPSHTIGTISLPFPVPVGGVQPIQAESGFRKRTEHVKSLEKTGKRNKRSLHISRGAWLRGYDYNTYLKIPKILTGRSKYPRAKSTCCNWG